MIEKRKTNIVFGKNMIKKLKNMIEKRETNIVFRKNMIKKLKNMIKKRETNIGFSFFNHVFFEKVIILRVFESVQGTALK